MSRNLDQILSEAAAQNLSLSAALESLIDRELEARNARSIERRFRLAHLGVRYSIDSFQFNHHKSRLQMKNRSFVLWISSSSAMAPASSSLVIPALEKLFWLRSWPGA